ncbi:YfiR family protein [Parahaliea mediterranea]|uniref:YfiR family protein n=1 Tax=Parahaliea mediterranea TaxID=651086 RepID=A0A939DHV3_9GAMM|nr:YfiR family protein [Parahaliea mediterranea]MBN7798384.1 YfiR family protein [Parahaliea mediterranea]
MANAATATVVAKAASACACLALLLLLGAGVAQYARAQADSALVQRQAAAVDQVVAGILSYVRWPQEPTVRQLCVVGPTEHADRLLQATHQTDGRPLNVQRRAIGDPQLSLKCNALYIGIINHESLQRLLSGLAGQPVLTISEGDPACSVGSAFCLHVGKPRVSFEVNLDAVARSGVRVHPSVLKLGKPRLEP